MALQSRRKAREGALRALYSIELSETEPGEAIESMVMETGLSHDLADYSERIVRGVLENKLDLDMRLAVLLKEYDYTRVAAVDRNILRMGAYELLHVPELAPAITINEAIEIAKKYSTADSGRFINGVLGRLLRDTPKANWDPATAPPEAREEVVRELEEEIEEITVEEGTPEAEEARKFGAWKIRSEGE